MSFNPYQPPTSAYDGNYTSYGHTGGAVSDRTVAALRKTRPWVLLIAVVSFVFTAFTLLLGLIAMAEEGAEGLVFVVSAAIYVVPGLALTRYARAINKLLHGGGVAELDQSMDAQASFWQIAGIYTLIAVVLSVLGFVLLVATVGQVLDAF